MLMRRRVVDRHLGLVVQVSNASSPWTESSREEVGLDDIGCERSR